ncbi:MULTISPECIES: phosphopantetheine-binding protein [Actinomadura]|uniref:Acyl carrier protein n=1 Tax=Actinomadura livida TaxID=79909 RepID=A0A7W7I8I6_9ACTN|nr:MULTISPECIES: phosphopantetheine-binding protein [Actinomadura]MBB4772381.1 acyl carrier protein [Actinomadura catellatispora]TDB98850.1 phosphopantetheine-binding protein [Actinomadura sp. 7K534]GGU23349.1 hypothetical protein GCM10010208_55520 [Actinomadura livida]
MGEEAVTSAPSAVREHIAKIWNELLDVQPGQETASFFQLKGQSITAVQIVTRIEEELDIWVDVGELFEDPDLDTFASAIVARLDTAA